MSDPDFMDVRQVGEFFGGAGKPLDPSTIRRWVRKGKLAKPVKIAKTVARWRRSDCEAALKKMEDRG